VIDGRGAEE